MDLDRLARRSDYEREIPMHGAVRVPAVIFADEALIRPMDQKGCLAAYRPRACARRRRQQRPKPS